MEPNNNLETRLDRLGEHLTPPESTRARITDTVMRRVVETAMEPPRSLWRIFIMRYAWIPVSAVIVILAVYLSVRNNTITPIKPGPDHVAWAPDPNHKVPDESQKSSDFDYTGYRTGFMDAAGTIVIPATYTEACQFSEGLCAVRFGGEKTDYETGDDVPIEGAWGYIDKKGEWVIQPQFRRAHDFREGLAAVRDEHGWGFIDKTGKWVIPPQFDGLMEFGKEGRAGLKYEGLWGYLDREGNVTSRPVYDYVGGYSEGLGMIMIRKGPGDEQYGFVDLDGNVVIPPQYSAAHWFSESLAPVAKDGKYGFINKNNEVIIPFQFEHVAYPFKDGLAKVMVHDPMFKYGLIDKTGKFVVEPMIYFDRDLHFNEQDGSFWGEYTDPETKSIVRVDLNIQEFLKYANLQTNESDIQEGLIQVRLEGGQYPIDGYINSQGKVVIREGEKSLGLGTFKEGLLNFSIRLPRGADGKVEK